MLGHHYLINWSGLCFSFLCLEAPAGLEPSITGLWCETAELNCTLPYLTKASVLTFALRCHIAALWWPRPSSLKLQETKDDRSFVQWYTKIRLWRLFREVHLRTLPPESINEVSNVCIHCCLVLCLRIVTGAALNPNCFSGLRSWLLDQ